MNAPFEPTPRPGPGAAPVAGSLLDGRWEIERVLAGAMGTVFILKDPASGSLLAAKTPRLDAALSVEARERFAVEARTWMSLGHHPNVVEALFLEDIAVGGEIRPFLFLEYVAGPTLEDVLKVEGRLALPVVLDLATGMAWGLAYAHGEGRPGPRIVHRDLKPENVFVTGDRVAKVSDFGIARALDEPDDTVAEGVGAGTPYYVAPEQMKNAQAADRRSDLYSYGAALYRMLTGRPPFEGPGLSALVLAVLRDRPAPPSQFRADVPPALERLVLACLDKNPDARPQTFLEVLLQISELREVDTLWTPRAPAGSCAVCGWLSSRERGACVLCGSELGPPMRYAPVSPRSHELTPTLGRTEGAQGLEIEGVEVRPRVPHAGDEVVITVLLGNPGSEPVEGVIVPFALPDRDAFRRVRAADRRFVGTVPPTAPGAPLRLSWSIVPLRPGTYKMRPPGAIYRAGGRRRRVVRGAAPVLTVQPAEDGALVGRDQECARLGACLDRVAEGGVALVLLLGASGMGKSRLTRQTWEAAGERGFLRARGRCLDRGVDVRGAFKEAARQLLGLPSRASGAGEVAAAVIDLLGDSAHASEGLVRFVVDELLTRPVARGESPARMWARFVTAAAQRAPLLLVLEDVQRDSEIGQIAQHVAAYARRMRAPVMVVLTGRAGVRGKELFDALEDEAVERDDVQVLTLGPLSEAECSAFVLDTFHPNDFDRTAPWLPATVAELTGGNPMLLVELVRALKIEVGPGADLVVTRGGAWTAGPELTRERLRASLPSRLDDLVLARLSEFGPDARDMLRAAAILGDVFETDLLRALLDDPPTFTASLAELEQASILRERAGVPPRIRFREPLVPELLDRALAAADPDEHRRLHGLAADGLAELSRSRGRNSLRRGRHLAAAGRGEEAVTCLIDAVERLVDRQAFGRARRIMDDITGLLAEGAQVGPRRMSRLRMLQGEVLRFTGDFAGALAAYRAILDQPHGGPSGGGRLATVYSKMGKVHEMLGQLDDALYCYAVGLSLREENGLEDDVPVSLANLGGLHLLRGELDRAAAYLSRALDRAGREPGARGVAMARVLCARLHLRRGDPVAARRDVRLALSAARASRNKRASGEAWRELGRIAVREGRLRAARHHFRNALRVHQEIGDRVSVAETWLDLAAEGEVSGDVAGARDALRRVVEIAGATGLDRLSGAGLMARGRLELAAGRPRAARASLESAAEHLRRAREGGEPPSELQALLATTYRLMGHERRATELLELAARSAAAEGEPDAGAFVTIAHIDALAQWGRRAEALALAGEARTLRGVSTDTRLALDVRLSELSDDVAAAADVVERAAKSANARARARALASLGFVSLRKGDHKGAAAALRRAAGLLRQRGTRDALLLAVLRALAQALDRDDPASARSAAGRATELAAELAGRGFSQDVCRGFLPGPESKGREGVSAE